MGNSAQKSGIENYLPRNKTCAYSMISAGRLWCEQLNIPATVGICGSCDEYKKAEASELIIFHPYREYTNENATRRTKIRHP